MGLNLLALFCDFVSTKGSSLVNCCPRQGQIQNLCPAILASRYVQVLICLFDHISLHLFGLHRPTLVNETFMWWGSVRILESHNWHKYILEMFTLSVFQVYNLFVVSCSTVLTTYFFYIYIGFWLASQYR